MTARRVTILGAGSIGVGFAVLFATSGARLAVFDPDDAARRRAREQLRDRLELLAERGLCDSAADALRAIELHADPVAAVAEAELVQECGPERVAVKAELVNLAARHSPADAVIASSSSAIAISRLSLAPEVEARTLVAHPGNPPYLLRVIELVPAPGTAPGTVARAEEIYRSVGLTPVRVRREVEGFVFNRLQGAVLREAYCLVRDGVASVADIDAVMRLGLGRRWSVLGPFETADLNVRGGIRAHAARMGASYARMGAERGAVEPWPDDLVAEVDRQRRDRLALADWDEAVRRRDELLMDLERLLGAGRAADGHA